MKRRNFLKNTFGVLGIKFIGPGAGNFNVPHEHQTYKLALVVSKEDLKAACKTLTDFVYSKDRKKSPYAVMPDEEG